MHCSPLPKKHIGQRGVALVIILAFLVLLSGLIVAFMVRALSARQVADSSAYKTRTELFAQGAVATLIGDLQQEIEAGSTIPSLPATPTPDTYLYFPKSAETAYPASVGRPGTATSLPNLLKRSAYQQPFFAGAAYDTANFAPSNRAANVSTTTLSGNLRSLSLDRWNRALMLPKQDPTSDSDFTPTTGKDGFTPPDWVLVSSDGTNPTAWNAALSNRTSPSFVVGRFAYVMYDEGGMLDMNAAGYPSTATARQSGSKVALSYADLTQLTDSSNSPLLKASDIDAIVAWRNYATSQPPSTFPTPGFDATSALNFHKGLISNNKRFLTTANTSLNNGQSDQLFSSRQQLMKLLLSGIASQATDDAGKAERARLQNALQYLSHFSRGLEQPSFVRAQSLDSTKPGYNASAPKILPANQGGNNAAGLDTAINPSFLTVRVKTAFKRNDGSDAVVGEPLVKKRFALNRLAWLTCKGPSADRATSSDPDIAALKNAGLTEDWLKLGTAQNIQKYFGLQWSSTASGNIPANYWQYIHGRDGSSGAIMRLDSSADSNDVVRAGREADFFELLKASLNTGSLAKVGTSVPKSGKNIPSMYNQYYFDYSVDNAIIQIGANIIDQFDTDSFPTRIVFNDGSNAPTVFNGIENLPYLNRVHPAVVKVVAPKVTSDSGGTGLVYYGTTDTLTGAQTVENTGLGATILIPELWNPHDWCGDGASQAQMDQTFGTLGPQDFEIYAESDVPVVVKAAAFYADTTNFNNGGDARVSPGFQDRGFSWAGTPLQLNEANSKMTFQITHDANGAQLFREPTALYMPNKPSGSSLNAVGLSKAPAAVLTSGNLVAKVGDGGSYNAGPPQYPGPPVVGQSYVGMYLGTIPLIWRTKPTVATPPAADTVYRANTVILDDNLGPGGLFTFNLQCKDAFGTLITYDQKKVSIGHTGEGWGRIARPMHATWAGLLQPRRDGERVYFALDPRTSRFALQNTAPETGDNTTTQLRWSYPPFSYDHLAVNRSAGFVPVEGSWLSRDEGIMGSWRNGWGNGAAVQAIDDNIGWRGGLNPINFPNSMGFFPGNQGTNKIWTWNDAAHACRPGLFAENDAALMYNDQICGDVQFYAGGHFSMANEAQYYMDPDGVVRRGMGGWSDSRVGYITPANLSVFDTRYATVTGLPMRVAHQVGTDGKLHKCDIKLNYPPKVPSTTSPVLQSEARPMILNRPFQSVAELGYTFSGTPWKNVNLDMPESGDVALLDVFCLNDVDDSQGLVAGKVSLNTRQAPVLKAIIAGAYKNEWGLDASAAASATLADMQAKMLVARTTGVVPTGVTISGSGARPLQNISDLVGKWVAGKTPGANPTAATAPPYGPTSYDGYTADILNPAYFLNWTNQTPNTDTTDDPSDAYAIARDKSASRRRNAPIRALANAGQTRVWNIMLDLVAQTGRYPQNIPSTDSSALEKFIVEGEQRYWVHLAIDRFTGAVLDEQIEIVNE